ncbi:MAG: SDR family oxidoreductase [Candidatus Gracilibacteria bacterium]|jgi:3-oxoacyl-[acyl-carrier protein] reductase|nr:SDR family oxidoreductase [Candidatus Gracilibacteria bacterium]
MKKIALITGATSGIGASVAKKFAQEGYIALVHGRGAKDFKIVDEIRSNGGKAFSYIADFLKADEIDTMFEKIKQDHSKIDVLINNAGMVNRKKVDDYTADDFQNLFMVNLTAQFLCARHAYHLGASNIINIGSMRALPAQATTIDYSASKAGIHNMTISLARAFAPQCRVNCVAPGFTRTPIHDTSPERLVKEASITPLQICAEPEDIAESIYFLASEKSRFTTGESLVVDGGRSFV